jgi:hypothetical protein
LIKIYGGEKNMKRKISIIIIIIMLLCNSSVIIYDRDVEVKATGESGGGNNGGIGLDNDFVWNVTGELSNVIRNAYNWEEGEIQKGRAWGTNGDRFAQNLTEDYMKKEQYCGLSEVQNITIGYLSDYPERNYSNKIEVNDFSFSISHPTEEYPFETPMSKTEIFPFASGYSYWESEDEITHNYTFNNVYIWNLFDPTENRGTNWPFGGTYNNYSLNVTSQLLNNCETIVGNVSYIENDDQIPSFQDGMVFIMNESIDCEEKIANITNAAGCILICNNSRGYQYQNVSSNYFPVVRVNETGNDNLTMIIDMLKNDEFMLVDNVLNNDVLTFDYNLSEQNCLPDYGYMLLEDSFGWIILVAQFLHPINQHKIFPTCHGFILYDSFDTHFMSFSMRDWDWFIEWTATSPALPIFSVNNSVGNWMQDNMKPFLNRPKVTGYLDQEYKEQTETSPGVVSYNVVGYRNITSSPDDCVGIISSRIDGFWGETPGDSGVGNAIILGIAKYFNDYNITPKYNLTFLMTTGEEYGMRGAQHFKDSHPNENYIFWIGTDQLGFNQIGTNLSIAFQNKSYTKSSLYNIISAIANETDYPGRSNNNYGLNVTPDEGLKGTELYVWKDIDSICFEKDNKSIWEGYHRTGKNYTKGDAFDNIDREDVNVTFELAWNVTKYFYVNPDCWFSNATFEAFDSPNDGDTLDDSIIANFTLNTILPYDLMMVNASLINSSSEEVVSNAIVNYTVTTGGSEKSITFSIPDDDTAGDYSLSIQLYNSTGRINEIVGISSTNYNDFCNSLTYHLYHPFGYIKNGESYQNINNLIAGSVFTANENAYADNITAYINKAINSPGPYRCMLYRLNDSKLIGNTSENWTSRDYEYPPLSAGWAVFNFSEPKPVLVQGTQYVITCWGEDEYCRLYYDDFSSQRGRYNQTYYTSEPPDYPSFNNENRLYSIYCSYTALNYGPNITSVNSNPDVTGFGMNVVISANVSDVDGVETVKVDIVKPETDPGLGSSYTMINTGGDIYEYVFNDTWIVGQYNYTIWAIDEKGYSSTSSQYSFNISSQATVTVCTVQDEYGNNTFVNVTDPPGDPPSVGYELMDDGKVLRIWNNYDSYYFNTTSGIQLTNHYNEYWSHNVLMLGYYNNNQWHLIYRTDELSGFNKNIDSDNETYVNATLWKDLTYQGYDFRLAIRYHLGVDDKELTVIPYIKNLGQAIPYNLGFAWEINDIQVDMTPGGDYIEINGTTYLLNQSLDETYKNLDLSCFYIREDISSDRSESLYLCWNDSLDYLVKVKSMEGQYNAPVTLGIKIGTLGVGQEKYTSLLWHDASEITYYFNSYSIGETWATNPSYMVDDSISTYASTTVNGDVELCNGNNCSGLNLGNITKVELRVYGYYTGTQRDIILRPVFSGTTDGLNYYYSTESSPAWSRWFDITTDPYKPLAWSWTDIKNLDCDAEAKSNIGFFTLYCSKVEIRVTYIPNSNPVVGNPYPADDSTGISIAPVLNITVSDSDGNSMNITWLSNSSGSWQVFGTNNSIGNGTYHQTMSNASVNGQWWYWKVNVTDGINYTESSVYKFYTGNQSKIKNTGSTNISGYLLMQVQFFDGYNWIVAADNCPNETTPRTILVGGQFGLDTVFNGKIHTAYLIGVFGTGLYRVYACFRDPDGNVLVCDDDSLMEATYEFTVNI